MNGNAWIFYAIAGAIVAALCHRDMVESMRLAARMSGAHNYRPPAWSLVLYITVTIALWPLVLAACGYRWWRHTHLNQRRR